MIYTKYVILSLLFVVHLKAIGQVLDDFSDNDLTFNPEWRGKITNFIIENGMLRLMYPPETGTACLTTMSQAINGASWSFRVRMDFNPSGSNYVKVYVVSDRQELDSALNGYFVKVGGIKDEICLYRQDGDMVSKIIDGADGRTDLPLVDMQVKVERDSSGNWTLFTDTLRSGLFIEEGRATDSTHLTSRFFGFNCHFTSTRSTLFYFDDITVTGNPYIDKIPPTVGPPEVLSENEVLLTFSEPIGEISASVKTNYNLNNGQDFPVSIQLLSGQQVKLTFLTVFPNGPLNSLVVSAVRDTAGNVMSAQHLEFRYIKEVVPAFRDLTINELMIDPEPVVGLPGVEYTEIMNVSRLPFDLTNWYLSDGKTNGVIGSGILLPGEYLLLTGKGNASLFDPAIPIAEVIPWPSLNNSGDTMYLLSRDSTLADSVAYTSSWYGDDMKKAGGWSLEQVDPYHPCGDFNNWKASLDVLGGTPGRINSNFSEKTDTLGPEVISAWVTGASVIEVLLNERPDIGRVGLEDIIIDPAPGIDTVRGSLGNEFAVELVTRYPLDTGVLYRLEINNLTDCTGNMIMSGKNKGTFAVPQTADSGDVIINEILFNPPPGGVDFVELYNLSDKYINLRGWKLGNIQDHKTDNRRVITRDNKLYGPGEYLAITPNPDVLFTHYTRGVYDHFMAAILPGFADYEGTAVLIDGAGQTLDSVYYHEDMHFELLRDVDGVSLERVSFVQSSTDPANWRSASTTVGYATPGYVNSHYLAGEQPENGLTVEPKVFIPDNNGTDDFTRISFNMEQGSWVATLMIYDLQGRPVRELASSTLVPSNGYFIWDGVTDSGSRAPMGLYLILFESFSSNGEVKKMKETVVVGKRF